MRLTDRETHHSLLKVCEWRQAAFVGGAREIVECVFPESNLFLFLRVCTESGAAVRVHLLVSRGSICTRSRRDASAREAAVLPEWVREARA